MLYDINDFFSKSSLKLYLLTNTHAHTHRRKWKWMVVMLYVCVHGCLCVCGWVYILRWKRCGIFRVCSCRRKSFNVSHCEGSVLSLYFSILFRSVDCCALLLRFTDSFPDQKCECVYRVQTCFTQRIMYYVVLKESK